MALLAADIDHFKKINDTHGHVNRADAALYKAKDAGRNRVSLSSQCRPANLAD